MLEENCHVTPVPHFTFSSCPRLFFKSPVVFRHRFPSPRHIVHAFSLCCCCCYMPYDNVCHLDNDCSALLFVLSAVSSCSWFPFYFHFFLSDFFFLCSSPDCMLVSQATFQSKHYSFFCSSNIFVPTSPSPPTSCLMSCSVEMSKPPRLQCFTLNPACSWAHCNRLRPQP